MSNKKLTINFYQRRPRKGFSFSLEFIFNDIRERLSDKINSNLYIARCYNDGYFSKLINIMQATFRQGGDVNHITGEVHFLNLLMNKNRVVLTIHDCGMMIRKTGTAKKVIKWLYLTAPINKAQIITTVSEVTKKEIIMYTGVSPGKIAVIPVGVSSLYKPSPKKFNKLHPVILHIGTGYNKNLLTLIKAIEGIGCHLTIVGKLTEEYLQALKESSIDYSNEYNITNERMVQKYQECDILAFISTFEGFGMPIVEANVTERVVVTSNLSSMPEVASNAAHLVNPYDIYDIRAGIKKVIEDDFYRQKLIENGRRNKLRFDGDTIAKMYLDLYMTIGVSQHNN